MKEFALVALVMVWVAYRAGRLDCLLHGHGMLETNERGRKFLRCYACGKESVGWRLFSKECRNG